MPSSFPVIQPGQTLTNPACRGRQNLHEPAADAVFDELLP
jgi:hypothetical protein